MEAINGDIYVMYYEPGAYSFDALKTMLETIHQTVAPKPAIALPNNISLVGMSRQEFLNLVSQILGGSIEDQTNILCSEGSQKHNQAPTLTEEVAKWKTWGGWAGNHDQRIEGATCTQCGYKHPTVYGSLKHLSSHCPHCERKIVGVIEF